MRGAVLSTWGSERDARGRPEESRPDVRKAPQAASPAAFTPDVREAPLVSPVLPPPMAGFASDGPGEQGFSNSSARSAPQAQVESERSLAANY